LTDDHKQKTQDLLDQATTKCNLEKAEFKQEYLIKYEKDIATLNGEINLKIQEDNTLLRESMEAQCDAKINALEADLIKQC